MSELRTVPAPQDVLSKEFGDIIEDIIEFRDEVTVVIPADRLLQIARFCHDHPDMDFNRFSGLTCVDHYPREPRFHLNYNLHAVRKNHRIRLRVLWADGEEDVPSVTGIWPSANWFEREAFDLFGVMFEGHPDLRRLLMPDDWDGHPLRKDYPLGYETVQFSFNYDEVNKHKPYADK
jgi:NADH-quinone oxidoreductase subunit C